MLLGFGDPLSPVQRAHKWQRLLACSVSRSGLQLCFASLLILSHCCKGSASPCSPSCSSRANASLLLEGFTSACAADLTCSWERDPKPGTSCFAPMGSKILCPRPGASLPVYPALDLTPRPTFPAWPHCCPLLESVSPKQVPSLQAGGLLGQGPP